jgi:hypothetical protein
LPAGEHGRRLDHRQLRPLLVPRVFLVEAGRSRRLDPDPGPAHPSRSTARRWSRQAIIKAGVFVEVLGISVVSIGINAGNDFSTMCTMSKIQDAIRRRQDPGDMVLMSPDFANDPARSLNLMKFLKDKDLNCSSFTTPFGPTRRSPSCRKRGMHLPADCDKTDIKTVHGRGKKHPAVHRHGAQVRPASLGPRHHRQGHGDLGAHDGELEARAATRVPAPGTTDVARTRPERSSNPTLPITFDNYRELPHLGQASRSTTSRTASTG